MRDKKRVEISKTITSGTGKTCPGCGCFKEWDLFGKNRSKADGHESSCKACVSKRKKKAYLKRKKTQRQIQKNTTYYSSIMNEISEDAIEAFCELLKESYRGLCYEGKI